MNWTSPGILTALWILPVFALLLWRQRKRQKRREELFLQSPMTGRLFPEATARRAFWRGALLLASLALLITALAGPRFGVYFEKVTRRGADILILLDTSRSMLAEDLAPNRLEAAKLDIEDLLSAVSGDRVGLIAFAGKPVIKVPLTSDFGFFRETLKGLDTHAAPMGGTAIGDAVRLALRAMAPDAARDQAILLITDGEDHESMPIEAAQSAAQRNVRLFTVALGDTKEGARIPLFDKNGKRTGFEQYNGQEVWSKADVDLLARLAETANGTFLSAGTGPCDLGEFYLSAMEDLSRAGYGQSQQRLLHEKYQLFLALGLAALTLWLAIPAAARPRWEEEIQPAARDAAERKTGAGAFLRRAIMPAAAAALALIGGAAPADTPPQTPPITTAQPTAEGADPRPAPEDISSEGISPEEFSPEEMTPEEWDESAGVESAQKEKKLSPRERYREACAKRDDPAASAEAEEIFDALMRGNEDKRLTPLCAYNLALIKARRLSEAAEAANAEQPDKSQPPNGAEEPANPADPNGGAPQARPKDPLTLYREGRAAREGKRREVRRQTAEAADLFREADDPKDSRLHREVTGNIDLLRSWLIGQEKRWADAERQKRLALGLPTHLAWLAGELDAVLAEPALAKDPAASKQYQGLYDLAGRIDEARADLRELADAAEMRGAVEGEKTDEPALDPQTASAAAEALERAVGDARRFARADTRDAVRLGAEKLDAGFNAVMDYRTVLSDALARQEKVVQRGKALAEKTAKNAADNQADSKADSKADNQADNQADNEAVGAMCWGDDFAGRKVERLIGEAEAEFQRQPWSDEEEQAAREEESAGEEDSVAEEDSTGEQPDEEQPNPALGGEDQQRAKLRRSMKAALDLGPEVGEILASLPASAEELPAIRAGEGRILEILREIERPLRDDQDQNSDSQDQNNQDNKNQNDKNQDNQDNQNRDNQNQDNQNQDNQDQNQDQDNQDQNSQNEEEQSAEEQSADEQDQRQRADQQQAEAAMRKVRQRQQQAEQMRRLRDEYQRRVDKPEKDW